AHNDRISRFGTKPCDHISISSSLHLIYLVLHLGPCFRELRSNVCRSTIQVLCVNPVAWNKSSASFLVCVSKRFGSTDAGCSIPKFAENQGCVTIKTAAAVRIAKPTAATAIPIPIAFFHAFIAFPTFNACTQNTLASDPQKFQ